MAKQPIDVGVKFTGDASGFQKAAVQAKNSTRDVRTAVSETTGVLDELGGAIGGVGGDIAGAISKIATAGSAIGVITVAVGLMANEWKKAKENIELYLKSADKLAAGPAAFQRDARTAMTDTRKRGEGQFAEGLQVAGEAQNYLLRNAKSLTKEQKEFYQSLVKSGEQMMLDGRKIVVSTYGIKNKHEWQRKYNALLIESDKLDDESLKKQVEWADLEAEIVKYRKIALDKSSTEKEKKDAIAESDKKINQLIVDKNTFLDRQIQNITAISEQTATQEVVEKQLADLQKQKKDNNREFYLDLIKIDRMENKIVSTTKKDADETERKLRALKALKEQNGEINPARTGQYLWGINKKSEGKYNVEDLAQAPGGIQDITTQSELALNAVQSLEDGFKSMVLNTKEGFGSLLDSFANMIAGMLAKAAVAGLLNIIAPGSGMAVAALTSFRSSVGVPGYANGTNFAPGGLSLVGENGPELVNLPRGSKVTPMRDGKISLYSQISNRSIIMTGTVYNKRLFDNT